jgi:hypothetical protein
MIRTEQSVYQIALAAIDLFIENRDRHGLSTAEARHAAAIEVDEGIRSLEELSEPDEPEQR